MKRKTRAGAQCSTPSNSKETTTSSAETESSSTFNNMKNTSTTNPSKNIKRRRTRAPPPPPPPSPPPPHTAGMPSAASLFNNAHNTHISGGSFRIETNIPNAMKVLHKRVAPNAILNAGGRADEVRCYPGTREEVINQIEEWSNRQDDQTAPMFWLSGPAGAGKSAIVQTVAEHCKQRDVPQANFFFFRGDTSRNHAFPLIATLLHQIILLYPSLRILVAAVLSINPLLFDATLKEQLDQLIFTPLRYISQSTSSYRPLLLLIDGLDECDSDTKHSQEQILRAIDTVMAQYSNACPFRVLVASRDESQIQVAFNKLSSQCMYLYLDEKYSPEDDIRVFVNAQFDEIRKTHRLAHTLDADWPPAEDVNHIVQKSSGQFIFSATVMRFISKSRASPMVSLERVRGVLPSTKSPFAHLDAIYTYILSQVDDREVLKNILSAHLFLTNAPDIYERLDGDFAHMYKDPLGDITLIALLQCFNAKFTKAIILSYLEDLTPLMKYQSDSGQLLFYHASMADYLLDQSRSGDYSLDIAAFTYQILPKVWKDYAYGKHCNSWALFGLCAATQLKELPPDLMDLVATSMKKMGSGLDAIVPSTHLLDILTEIYKLCTRDSDITNFRLTLRVCINRLYNTSPYNVPDIRNKIWGVPFGNRYFQMARADDGLPPDTAMVNVLRPQSDFDRRESASWLEELLPRLRDDIYRDDAKYAELLTKWISWAGSNNIPCKDLAEFTCARRHT